MNEGADFESRGLAMTTPHPLGERIVKAEGCWIETDQGERLFDLVSGIGVSALGHGNQRVAQALHDQIDKHLHVMVYGEYAQEPQDLAARVLLGTLGQYGLDSVYFVNSGTEAIEGAMKLARRVTGRSEIFGLTGGYHGATTGALSLSTPSFRRDAFLPLLPEVGHLPFGEMEGLQHITSRTAAVFAETVQGDAGIRPLSESYFSALRNSHA